MHYNDFNNRLHALIEKVSVEAKGPYHKNIADYSAGTAAEIDALCRAFGLAVERGFDRYQEESRRTLENPEKRDWLSGNGDGGRYYDSMIKLATATGVAGEAGEIVDLVKKNVWHNKDVDVEKIKEEIGDLFFYVAGLATLYGFSLADAARANVAKLWIRFPGGFSSADANARADKRLTQTGRMSVNAGPSTLPKCRHGITPGNCDFCEDVRREDREVKGEDN